MLGGADDGGPYRSSRAAYEAEIRRLRRQNRMLRMLIVRDLAYCATEAGRWIAVALCSFLGGACLCCLVEVLGANAPARAPRERFIEISPPIVVYGDPRVYVAYPPPGLRIGHEDLALDVAEFRAFICSRDVLELDARFWSDQAECREQMCLWQASRDEPRSDDQPERAFTFLRVWRQ